MQKYLAADKLYRSRIPSGEVEADTLANIMMLYRKTNRVKTRDGLRDAPVFKSVAAAILLGSCPKFSTEIGGSSASSRGYRPSPVARSGEVPGGQAAPGSIAGVVGGAAQGVAAAPGANGVAGETGAAAGGPRAQADLPAAAAIASDDAVAAAVGAAKPSEHRPAGAKMQKLAVAGENAAVRAASDLAQSVGSLQSTMSASSRRREVLAGFAVETNLLAMMAEGEEKQRRVQEMMERAKDLREKAAEGLAAPGSSAAGSRGP